MTCALQLQGVLRTETPLLIACHLDLKFMTVCVWVAAVYWPRIDHSKIKSSVRCPSIIDDADCVHRDGAPKLHAPFLQAYVGFRS